MTQRNETFHSISCLQISSEFHNPSLYMRVRDEYLNERSHLRNTGIKTVRIHHGRFVKRSESDGPSLDQDGNYR